MCNNPGQINISIKHKAYTLYFISRLYNLLAEFSEYRCRIKLNRCDQSFILTATSQLKTFNLQLLA